MLKAWLSARAGALLTAPRWRSARHAAFGWRRRAAGGPATVYYFHQADDPYSLLAAQLLPALTRRYRIALAPQLVPPPSAAAAPAAQALDGWAMRDAQQLAAALGRRAPGFQARPGSGAVAHCQQLLAQALRQGEFAARAARISHALWDGSLGPAPACPDAEAALAQGGRLRGRLGHYLGATFYFEGEWYWGADRLHYLEQRLCAAGLARGCPQPPLAPPPPLQWRAPGARRPVLHFYCSLRSPYTYLAAPRVAALAAHYGAELRLRYVLPMVMRGLPVPRAKRAYILQDVKREAERLGLPFGRAVDPVGAPVERGLAVLEHAAGLGRGPAFLLSFLQGVFADGIDAGSARGLQAIAARAGLSPQDVGRALAGAGWRQQAEANRADLLARGLWGVPSFRIDEQPALWGQDRLWLLERGLAAAGGNAFPPQP